MACVDSGYDVGRTVFEYTLMLTGRAEMLCALEIASSSAKSKSRCCGKKWASYGMRTHKGGAKIYMEMAYGICGGFSVQEHHSVML